MITTKNFKDFLIDLLLEDNERNFHGVTELPFVMSNRLKDFLKTITHTISKRLLELDKSRKDEKITFVDLDDDDYSKFTIVNSNKAYDNIYNEYKNKISVLNKDVIKKQLNSFTATPGAIKYDYWTKNRVPVKIGKFIGKIFSKEYKQGGDPGNDIESFVQSIVAKRENKKNRFKLVSGNDIVKYYNEYMYDIIDLDGNKIPDTKLGDSCMKYDKCSSYVNFYVENGVKMLILFSDVDGRDDQIVGRSIIWELSNPSGRTFMDRIYYRYESDMFMFKQYAEKQGWLHKKNQNMQADTDIVDTLNNTIKNLKLYTKDTIKETSKYPYMDTMKYFDTELHYLTNDATEYEQSTGEIYDLESTHGDYDTMSDSRIWVEYYEESYDEEDLVFCGFGDEYRLYDDATWLAEFSEYATEEYVEEYLTYSDFEDHWLEREESIYSEYHDSDIHINNSITLSVGVDEKDIKNVKENDNDIRHVDDIGDNVIHYIHNGEDYYFEYNDENENYFYEDKSDPWHTQRKHKIWDKKEK